MSVESTLNVTLHFLLPVTVYFVARKCSLCLTLAFSQNYSPCLVLISYLNVMTHFSDHVDNVSWLHLPCITVLVRQNITSKCIHPSPQLCLQSSCFRA